MKWCYKLLSVFMVLVLATSFGSISFAAEDSSVTKQEIKLEGSNLYAYGVPVLIEKDSDGCTRVYRNDDSKTMLGEIEGPLTIYGGGKNEPVTGDVSITVDGASYTCIYGGGYSDGSGAADVRGNVSVTVKGNVNANAIFGGGYAYAQKGNASANVSGSVTVDISAEPQKNHESFSGGGYARVDDKYSASANVGKVNLYVTGRTYSATGGGSATAEAKALGKAVANVKGSVSIHLKDVDIREVYSGGYANGPHAIADAGSVETMVDGTEVMSLSGGGRAFSGGQANVAGTAKIHLKDCSNLYGYIYGGGEADSKGTAKTGSAQILIENCTVPVEEQLGQLVAGAVISGGSASGEGSNADVSGPVQLDIKGGKGAGNIYGGGSASGGGKCSNRRSADQHRQLWRI